MKTKITVKDAAIVVLILALVSVIIWYPRYTSMQTGESQSTENTIQPAVQQAWVVEIRDSAFSPSTLEIKKGDEVVWINKGNFVHTISAFDGSFSYKTIAGQYAMRKFDSAGEYQYRCSIHGETGTIIVK